MQFSKSCLFMALTMAFQGAQAYSSLNEAVSSTDPVRSYSIGEDITVDANLGVLNGTSLTIDGNHHAVVANSGKTSIEVGAGKTLIVRNIGSFTVNQTPEEGFLGVTVDKAWRNFMGVTFGTRKVGGLGLNSGTIAIYDSAFGPNNSGSRAALLYNLATIEAIENTVVYNAVTGALVNSKADAVIHAITDSYFIGNYYNEWGAVLNNEDGAVVEKISGSYFVGNTSTKKSSVINNVNATIGLIENSVFKDNVVVVNANQKGGGGIHNENSTIGNILNTDFIGNLAVGPAENQSQTRSRGPAIFNTQSKSSVTITDSRFIDNASRDGGAAIWNADKAVMHIRAVNADTVFSGNLSYATFEEIVPGKSYSVVSGTPNDIHNTATLYLDAAAGRSVILGGGVSGDDPNGSKGVIHINNSLAGATGTVYFGGILEKNRVNVYAGTLKLGADNLANTSILNLVGGTLDLANDQAGAMNIVRIDGSGANLRIDTDFDTSAADRIATSNASTGTLTLTGINLIAQDPPAILNQTKTFRVVNTQNNNLRLADGLARDSQGRYRFRDFVEHEEQAVETPALTWDADYNIYDITKDILGTVEVFTGTTTNDSIRVTVTDLVETGRVTTPRDALSLLNRYATDADRTFTANAANQTHVLTTELGATTAGRLEVVGLTGSVLDFNEKSGFLLSNATELGFTNLTAQNASDNVVTIENALASVVLTDSVVKGRIEGEVGFNLTASGANTIEGSVSNAAIANSGTLTLSSGATPSMLETSSVTGTGSLVIAGDVILDGASFIGQAVQVAGEASLAANADSLQADVVNAGLLSLKGGTLEANVSGPGTLQIAGDTTLSSAASIVQDTLALKLGTLDLTEKTDASGNINFTDPASPVQIGTILAQGGRLDFQDGKTGLITFGAIDTTGDYTDDLKLGIGIDLDLTHGDMKADLLKFTGGFSLIQEGSIVIDSIHLLTEWPSELGIAIKISDDQVAGLLDVADNALEGSDENLLLSIEDIRDDPDDEESPVRTYMRLGVSSAADVIHYYAPVKNYTLSEDVTVSKAEQDAIIEAYIATLDDPSAYNPEIYNPATDQMGFSMTISGSDSPDERHTISTTGEEAPQTYVRLYTNTQVLRVVNTDIEGFSTPLVNDVLGTIELKNANVEGTIVNGGIYSILHSSLRLEGDNTLDKVAGGDYGAGTTFVLSGTTLLKTSIEQDLLIVGNDVTGEDATFVNEGEVDVREVQVVTEDSVLENKASGTIAAELITNVGRIDNLGTMAGSIENAATGRIYTDADKIATGEYDTIANEGAILFTGGTLSKSIEAATGTEARIVVAGEVAFAPGAVVAQNVQIAEGFSLEARGESLGADVANEGSLKLSGGTLEANVSGAGATEVTGEVVLGEDKAIAQNVRIAEGAFLSASASGLRGNIETAGTLEVSDGTLNRAIAGSGLVLVNGAVINLGTIDAEVRVANGWLYSYSESLAKPVTLAEDTHLYLGGPVFANTVHGNGTVHFLEDALWQDAQVSASTSVRVEQEVTLDIDGNRLTLNELLLDGNLKIGITDLTASSSEYEGGHISVSRLEIGESAKLLLKVSPGLLTHGTGETDGLVLIDENGKPAQATFDVANIVINMPYAVNVGDDGTYRIRNLNHSFDFEGSANNHRTADAWMSTVFPAESLGEAVQDALIVLQNTDVQAYAETLTDIAPNDSAAGVALASANLANISQQIGARLAGTSLAPRSSLGGGGLPGQGASDALASQNRDGVLSRGLWVAALHGHARDKGDAEHAGFKMRSSSVILGGDGEIAPGFTLGLGYAYDRSKIYSGAHTAKADSHNAFVYGQYEDDGFYVQGLFGAGASRLKDSSVILGMPNGFRHTDENLHAALTVGKRFDAGLTLRSGLKWMHLDRGSYTDGFGQGVDNASVDITTLSAGADFAKSFEVGEGSLGLSAFATVNYDVGSSAARSAVTVGSATYLIEGKKPKAFGVDAGASLSYRTDSWYFSLEYQRASKGEYRSHTGMLTVRKTF